MKDWGIQFLLWREKHITEKTVLAYLELLLSGIFTSLAAILLKSLIHSIQTISDTKFLMLREQTICISFIRLSVS